MTEILEDKKKLIELLAFYKDAHLEAYLEIEYLQSIQLRIPTKYIQIFASNFLMIEHIHFNPQRSSKTFRIMLDIDKIADFNQRLIQVTKVLKKKEKNDG